MTPPNDAAPRPLKGYYLHASIKSSRARADSLTMGIPTHHSVVMEQRYDAPNSGLPSYVTSYPGLTYFQFARSKNPSHRPSGLTWAHARHRPECP